MTDIKATAVNALNCLLWIQKVVLQGQEVIPCIKI